MNNILKRLRKGRAQARSRGQPTREPTDENQRGNRCIGWTSESKEAADECNNEFEGRQGGTPAMGSSKKEVTMPQVGQFVLVKIGRQIHEAKVRVVLEASDELIVDFEVRPIQRLPRRRGD